ncbi:AAA family ATPase [Solibacillus daqui]|uniref:AAA family ATPase n=1 Tax=Solibacillus daqui TaxID=2912187 RepID=UPI002365A18E|nr:SMC family ATPase [Solibacillus daqui]
MKPLKLSMTAFGPYKDKEVIDFTQLHEHGIFVVSGSTGAGKTTIFDAITFALYDAGSGEDRDKSLFLRSDFADITVDTEVELEFEVRGRIYRIWRKFGHDGDRAKREFYDITGGQIIPAVEKFQVKLVQAKVEELIGLTQSQFNQIVMLPQGEFQKLLTSESKHKEEIFRKIFKTERFTKMVELLRDKKKQADKLYEHAQMQQDHTIQEIKSRLPERESALFVAINYDAINMYQIKQGLIEEQGFYEQQSTELSQQYEQVKGLATKLNIQFSEQKLINERIERFMQRQTELSRLQQQQNEMAAQEERLLLAQKAHQIEPLERELTKLKSQLQSATTAVEKAKLESEQAKQQLITATLAYENVQKDEALLETYTKNISQLEQIIPIYETIDIQRNHVDQLKAQQLKAQTLYDNLQGELVELKLQQQNQQNVVTVLEQAVAQYEQTFEAHATATRNVELVKETAKLQMNIELLKADALSKEQQATKAEQALHAVEQQIRSNQAAFLAASLHNGDACPVCGSTEHPAIHNSEMLQVDDTQIEQLRQQSDAARQSYYQVQSKLEIEQQTNTEKHNQIQRQQLQLEALAQYEEQLQTLASHLADLRVKQQQLTTERTQLEQFNEKREVIQGRLEKGQAYVQEIQTQLAQEKGKLEQSELSLLPQFTTVAEVQIALSNQLQQHQSLKNELKRAFDALQQAQLQQNSSEVNQLHEVNHLSDKQHEHELAHIAFATSLQNEHFSLESYQQALLAEQAQHEIRQMLEAYKQQLHTLTAQITEDQEQLEGKQLADLTELQQHLTTLNNEQDERYAAMKQTESYGTQCLTTLQKLEQSADQIESYKVKLQQMEHVYDLVRGQNDAKISFERFAQIGYLEKVTHAANERLRILSNGQYFLKSTGRKEGNAQSGLSIDVYDSNTGQTRDVKTLSGGEKFNASLSLALGMADVIQSVQGSVHIDTMFIDEGFGTLDEEALRRAIDILIDLQQTGRLIGIISHVAELKAAMPAILQVKKLKEGHSTTEIIVK